MRKATFSYIPQCLNAAHCTTEQVSENGIADLHLCNQRILNVLFANVSASPLSIQPYLPCSTVPRQSQVHAQVCRGSKLAETFFL